MKFRSHPFASGQELHVLVREYQKNSPLPEMLCVMVEYLSSSRPKVLEVRQHCFLAIGMQYLGLMQNLSARFCFPTKRIKG